ncbi:unnamed protein product, partial [Allacma fusca]
LARLNEWYTLELSTISKIDEDFSKKFTDQVNKIYKLELSKTSNFSVFPQKATQDQPKIVIMLKKPLDNEDLIRIEFARGGDVTVLDNVAPTNPYTAIVRIPESFCADKTTLLEITLFVNKQKLGTKLVKYEYQLKPYEEDVIEKISKAVPGFNKLLDDHISRTLSKNFRACHDWSLDPELELMNDVLVSKGDDFPTLMHFSAFYGLEKTVWTLLDEADGFEQCGVRNDVNETPLDIAQGNVGHIIKDYQEMTMSWKAFQFVKDLVARNSDAYLYASENAGQIGNSIDGNREAFVTDVEDTANNGSDLTQSIPSEMNRSCNNRYQSSESEEILEDEEEEAFDDAEYSPETVSDELPFKAPSDSIYANIILPTTESPVENRSTSRRRESSVPSSLPRPPRRRDPKRESNQNTINYANINPADLLMGPKAAPSLPSKPLPSVSVSDEAYDFPPSNPYKIPPKLTRPFYPDIPTSAVITPQPGGQVRPDPAGYLPMNPPESPSVPQRSINDLLGEFIGASGPFTPSTNPLGPLPPTPLKLDPPDEDLIEIMNDFKNNVYSMKQLELLFEHWKRRTDVKMSYHERQSRLKQMRAEYSQIQEKINRGQRRPSVLEKVFHLLFKPGRKKASTSGSSTPAVPEAIGVEPEFPPRKLSPNQSTRKTSNHSDRSSIGSSHSTGKPEVETLARERQVPWVNPMRNNIVSYVDPQLLRPSPSETPQAKFERPPPEIPAAETPNQSPHYKEPPRVPPKSKSSLTSPQPPLMDGTSPPKSPRPPPKKGVKSSLPVEKGSPPPLPPPKLDRPSPFRFINYERRAPDGTIVVDRRNDGSWTAPATNGESPAWSKQPYENTMGPTQSDLNE